MSEAPPRAEETAPDAGDRSGAASEAQRRAKVERLRAAGINPYPHSFEGRDPRRGDPRRPRSRPSWGRASTSEFTYRVMGRVTGKRGHGKVVFLDVRDITGTIQAYARRDALGEEAFERIEELDIGDLVGVEGPLYVTKRGQLAIGVRECTLLAKALLDPPDLFHGISDPELRYRQRELDLMANEESREIFKKRSKLTFAIRKHMNERGWVELETPVLQRLTGGAAARPVRHPPQRARPRPLPAHRDRALPEAGDRRRLRGRLRVRQVLPQRGDVAPAQPRVHDAGDVRRRRRLQRRHGVHRECSSRAWSRR